MEKKAKGNYRFVFVGGKDIIHSHKSFYDDRVVEINGRPTQQVEVYCFGELTWINVEPRYLEYFKES